MTTLFNLNIGPAISFALDPADVESIDVSLGRIKNPISAGRVTITLKSGRVLTSSELVTRDTPAEVLRKIIEALNKAKDSLAAVDTFLATPYPST